MSKLFNALITKNREVSQDFYLIQLEPLSEIPPSRPGNFFMLSVDSSLDPLLKRPLSVHSSDGKTLRFLYRVQGRGTNLLKTKKAGAVIELLGPLGNHFPLESSRGNIILAAGGIGIAPIFFLAREVRDKKPVLFYGARTEKQLLLVEKLSRLGIELRIATDDGSAGTKGDVAGLISRYLRKESASNESHVIYACGPHPMLRKLSELSVKYSLRCYAAMERNMACGVGTCLGCVIMTKKGYKRVCREGPVFDLSEIVWDENQV